MSAIDYSLIENAFKRAYDAFRRDSEWNTFNSLFQRLLDGDIYSKAFLVIGGSYAERMMTPRSDLDMWLLICTNIKSLKGRYKLNDIFNRKIVDPAIDEIQKVLSDIRKPWASVRIFRDFTTKAHDLKDPDRRRRRISGGMSTITFGRIVEINDSRFGNKTEYLNLRKEFKQFWINHGVSLWDIHKDKTDDLEKACDNLKNRKGKSLYRLIQLTVRQISEAYGMPEKSLRDKGLKEKLFSWTGRPTFVKHRLGELIPIVSKMRNNGLKASGLSPDEYNLLEKQLTLFTKNVYKPFRCWLSLGSALINVFEAMNVEVRYTGSCKSHLYMIFESDSLNETKGVDIEKTREGIIILSNLGGKRSKDYVSELLNRGFNVYFEGDDQDGEIVHKKVNHINDYEPRRRVHVSVGTFKENDLLSEKPEIIEEIKNRLFSLENILAVITTIKPGEFVNEK